MGNTVKGVDREISEYERQWWRKQAVIRYINFPID